MSITLEITDDSELIRNIMTHPRVFPNISDDGTAPKDDWQPIQNEAVKYVLAKDGGEILGLWMFVYRNVACWEVHTCLLPNAWGERAKEAVKQLYQWAWDNIPAARIVTEVPDYNRVAYQFALFAGMEQYGLNPKAYKKHGQLFDIILLGISRPEVNTCQPQP